MNHCGTHKCSSYCLKMSIMKELYNLIKHEQVKDSDIVTENYIPYEKLNIAECRMDYRTAQIFYSSGKDN